MSSVGQLVHTIGRAATADQTVEVVGRVVDPGRIERRKRPAHRESSELDERIVEAERAAGNTTIRGVRDATKATGLGGRGVNGAAGAGTAIGARGPGEVRVEERANHAILGRSARIDSQIFTRASGVIVRQSIVRGQLSGVRTAVIRAVQSDFSTQITAQLDAGVSAGDIEEARTIQ